MSRSLISLVGLLSLGVVVGAAERVAQRSQAETTQKAKAVILKQDGDELTVLLTPVDGSSGGKTLNFMRPLVS
jgi:hypothetical protein